MTGTVIATAHGDATSSTIHSPRNAYCRGTHQGAGEGEQDNQGDPLMERADGPGSWHVKSLALELSRLVPTGAAAVVRIVRTDSSGAWSTGRLGTRRCCCIAGPVKQV